MIVIGCHIACDIQYVQVHEILCLVKEMGELLRYIWYIFVIESHSILVA